MQAIYPPAQPGGEVAGSQPAKKDQSAKERVIARFPNAFAHDDGEKVVIYNQKEVTSDCPHCGQPWTRLKTLHSALGSGGTEGYAWESAAKSLFR